MKNDLDAKLTKLWADFEPEGDSDAYFSLAKELEINGNRKMAAVAYDRAYGLDPDNIESSQARKLLLGQMARVENGIKFRYIPGGTFLMGSMTGESDEEPVHPVSVNDFWISEAPISWAAFADLMDWTLPPWSSPKNRESLNRDEGFSLMEENKIRMQYCEDATTRAEDWHAHLPGQVYAKVDTGEQVSGDELFGTPEGKDPKRPWKYDQKPMVCVSQQEIDALCKKISSQKTSFRLPTEAEWEKSARGGLINKKYPWGDELPDKSGCDFNRFNEFSIQPVRRFQPNGYGLYAMSGGVWEWTSDWYDSQYYEFYDNRKNQNPRGPKDGIEKVLRGGSWADCADVCTVSYRMSMRVNVNDRGVWGAHFTPNFGFRLVMTGENGRQG
jgi:formylglycine-generating enzyme required for sulfatase activity